MRVSFFDAVLPTKTTGWTPIILRGVKGGLTRFRWFNWPAEKDAMEEYVEDHRNEDVYFSPFLYKEPYDPTSSTWATKANLTAARCVWADGDDCPLESIKFEPTIVLQSSERHWQAYWVPTDGEDLSPEDLEALSHGIYMAHAKEGLDSGWALAKKMRVPGTTNAGYTTPFEITYKETGREEFTCAELAADYEPVFSEAEQAAAYPETLPTVFAVLNEIDMPEVSELFMNDGIAPLEVTNRSEKMYWLQCLMWEYGCSIEQVFVVMREFSFNKFRDRPNGDNYLWLQLHRDYKRWSHDETLRKQIKELEESGMSSEHLLDATGRKGEWASPQLIYPYEEVPTDTIVDMFQLWAHAKSPQSPKQFHVCGALSLLSALFARYAYVPLSFGDVPLNLYFLVLGRTTQSRKSTSLRLSQKIVYKLTKGEPDKYLVPDDATPEALTQYLGTKPFESSLYTVDEVQDLFASANRKGSYMAAIIGFLTKAYDGQLPGVLRKSQEKQYQKSVPHYLSFYGTGILSVAAKYLTAEKIDTGFVPRCLVAIDDRVKFKPGADDLYFKTGDELSAAHIDAGERVITKLLETRLQELQSDYEARDKVRLAYEDPRFALGCDEDAFDRWKAFMLDATTMAAEHETYSRELFPLTERMGMSTLKVAGLLALVEGCASIQMRHMVKAISFAHIWMPSSEIFVSEISNTRFSQSVDEIISYVANSQEGAVTYTKLLAKFQSQFNSARELTDAIQFAQRRGMLSEEILDRTQKGRIIRFTGRINK